jgi:hypothetical protein
MFADSLRKKKTGIAVQVERSFKKYVDVLGYEKST